MVPKSSNPDKPTEIHQYSFPRGAFSLPLLIHLLEIQAACPSLELRDQSQATKEVVPQSVVAEVLL